MIRHYSKEELAALAATDLHRLEAELRHQLAQVELTDGDYQHIIVTLDMIVRIRADQRRQPTLQP
ncbi:hypothetical protein [uncultured Tateyamaria sp.]|uniref:hypothetical protein n=1 Tax=uncultured Tateyamaria sp. TaxID=455651 RepID=UPI00263996C2|nr:hypothetical protein [uncultured Tateyamaria sp.]